MKLGEKLWKLWNRMWNAAASVTPDDCPDCVQRFRVVNPNCATCKGTGQAPKEQAK